MKKLLCVLSLAFVCAGCQNTKFVQEQYSELNGEPTYKRIELSRTTFVTKTEVGEFDLQPTTNSIPAIKLRSYRHDQVEGVKALGTAAGNFTGAAVNEGLGLP